MKYFDQKGFSVLDIILVGALVAVIGVAGYSAYQNMQNKSGASHTASATPKANPTATTDPYVGWKTYNSKVDAARFHYPADWKISNQSYAGRDMVTVTSPAGSSVIYDSNVSGVGSGHCNANNDPNDSGPACVNMVIKSVEALAKSPGHYYATGKAEGYWTILFVLGDAGNIKPKLGDTGTVATGFHPTFKSKDGKRDITFETIRLGDEHADFKPADEATIKLIMMSYQD